jgi:site-specific recombinase XerD
MRAAGASERTVREWAQIVARATRETGCTPDGLTTEAIEAWLAGLTGRTGQTATPGTKAAYRVALRAWSRWLVLAGHRSDDPTERVSRARVPRRHPRPISTADLEQLLASRLRRRTRVMIHLGAFQGLRVHEIARLRAEDLDLGNRTLTITGKGGVTDTLPLHTVVAADAAWMPARGWWFPATCRPGPVRRDSVSTVISAAMARAGVRGTAHQLRHWYGTELVRAGADIRVVQTLMRHASLSTTALYVEVDADAQRAAIARLALGDAA